MNLLQYESSPYLQQHAANPVDWYPWGDEAIEKAKRENKPILVSIGYSTCHWCHVMERESFEDEKVAAFMNAYFVNIKVDREERPDLDEIYMSACQVVNGNGGWPLNCFLTPDLKPFYAGMYFPPKALHGRKSWTDLLQFILYNFNESRSKVNLQADRILQRIQAGDDQFISGGFKLETAASLKKEDFKLISALIAQNFDLEFGGFSAAPKFPNVMQLEFLLVHDYFTKDPSKLQHVHFSIKKMIQGGIYDQIGGGFARYSTDREWLAPHFEKMLYDNALLVSLICDLYMDSNEEIYKETIHEVLVFMEREMIANNGGFYAALDADSEGVEGKFYVWNETEFDSILGDDSEVMKAYYDVSTKGNWEGVSILRRTATLADFLKEKTLDKDDFSKLLTANKQKLLSYRAQRVRPGRDDKILLSWNALMISAYIKAYSVLEESAYLATAERCTRFILNNMKQGDGGLFHTYAITGNGQGKAKNIGFLEDYASFINALIDLYEVTFNETYLKEAEILAKYVIKRFYDSDSKLFFFTSDQQTDIVLRSKNIYDSTMPSGNSMMALNLMKLGMIFENKDFLEKVDLMLKSVQESIKKSPTPFGFWAKVLLYQSEGLNEIAIIGKDAFEKARAIKKSFHPNTIIMASLEANEKFPLFRGRKEGFIYLCQNYACKKPVETVKELLEQI